MKILYLSIGSAPVRFVNVAAYPENYIKDLSDEHEILTFGFNDGVDIKIRPEDDFSQVIRKLPHGWTPQVCILWNVEWYLLPRGIEKAPFPVVLIEMDWDYDIPLSKAIVSAADLVVTIGKFEKEALKALGARAVEIFYSQGIMEEYIPGRPVPIKERPYDIYYSTLFINDLDHLDRSRWIIKLCSLPDRYKVFIGSNPDHNGYIEDLRKAKLVFSYHRYGSMSSRFLDAAAQGSIVVEPGDEVKSLFEPHQEYIPVNEYNFIHVIEEYLNNQSKLQEISDRIYENVTTNYEARSRFSCLLDFIGKYFDKTNLTKSDMPSDYAMALTRGEVCYYSSYRTGIKNFFVNLDMDYLLKLGIDEFKKATAINPTPRAFTSLAIALTGYGSILFQLGKIREAEDVNIQVFNILNKVIKEHPSYIQGWLNLGMIYFRKGEFNLAEKALSRTLDLLDQEDSELDIWVLHNRDFDLFNKMIRKSYNHNLLLYLQGHKDKAIENIRNIYKAFVHYLMSIIMDKKGKIFEALQYLVDGHNLYPECAVIAETLAERLAILGYDNEAIEIYKNAIALQPLNIDLRLDFIKLLYLHNMDEDVMNEINMIMKITKRVAHRKDKITSLKELVNNLHRFNDIFRSYDSMREELLLQWVKTLFSCLKINNDFRIMMRIIDILKSLGRFDKAMEVLGEFINLRRNHLNNEEAEIIKGLLQEIIYAKSGQDDYVSTLAGHLQQMVS